MLGGPYVNPWVQLFDDRLNFRTHAPSGSVSEMQNTHPEKGEESVYRAHNENGVEVSCLRIALPRSSSGPGPVLLIGGIRGVSLEAGSSFLVHPAPLGEILKWLGALAVSDLHPVEL